jgi:hypothetical protein
MPSKIYREKCNYHDKWSYPSRKEARRIAREHHGEHKAVYPCTFRPDWYHVGELDSNVIAGILSREERYRSA